MRGPRAVRAVRNTLNLNEGGRQVFHVILGDNFHDHRTDCYIVASYNNRRARDGCPILAALFFVLAGRDNPGWMIDHRTGSLQAKLSA